MSSALNRSSSDVPVKIRTGCFQASLIQTTYGFGAWKHPLRAIVDGKFDDCCKFNTRTLGSAGAGTVELARFVFALTLSGASRPSLPNSVFGAGLTGPDGSSPSSTETDVPALRSLPSSSQTQERWRRRRGEANSVAKCQPADRRAAKRPRGAKGIGTSVPEPDSVSANQNREGRKASDSVSTNTNRSVQSYCIGAYS